jgi:hypothetical protein
VLKYFKDFEILHFKDPLKKVAPLSDFFKEAKLLTWVYDDTISSRQLSLVYNKFDFSFISLIPLFA